MAIPTWTVGQVLASADVNSWFVPKAGYKVSATTYSTTTLTSDPDLQVSLAANAVYEVRAAVSYQAASASDVGIDQGWYGPSGASIMLVSFSAIVNGVTPGPAINNNILTSGEMHTPAGAATPQGAFWLGTVTIGSTAGTFGTQFREHTASNTVTVNAGSYLVCQRIS